MSKANGHEQGLRSYSREVSELSQTYTRVLTAGTDQIESLICRIAGKSTLYVGSGGALGVARLSADLHSKWLGAMAKAVTPLELAGMDAKDCALVAFSARARHRDLDFALNEGKARCNSPIAVLTLRKPDRDETHAKSPVEFLVLPEVYADGFLATNSVLLMAGLIVKAHLTLQRAHLPDSLPWLHQSWRSLDSLRPLGILLHAPPVAAVAIDLEARLSETGLMQTQVTDYRNFAHGRHRGFHAMANNCSVVAIVHPSNRTLAEATLRELPKDAHLVKLETELPGAPGTLDLFVAAMKLTEASAKAQQIEPGKSEVPAFGRRLYHLDPTPLVRSATHGPIELKLAAAGILHPNSTTLETYGKAYDAWKRHITSQLFVGLLLDYDGTCVCMASRDAPPPRAVQEGLTRLLAAGIPLAFATGRGKSLLSALRSWIPQQFWPSVKIGLYNGAYRLQLSDEPGSRGDPEPPILEAYNRISSEPYSGQLLLEPRTSQLTISPRPHEAVALIRLAQSVGEALSRPPTLPLVVGLSAHSVDVTLQGVSKAHVLDEMEQLHCGPVLAIGDQGALGGNDFAMLSCTPFSLSVDRCSSDVTRCWRLPGRGVTGPDLLGEYLEQLQLKGSCFVFRMT